MKRQHLFPSDRSRNDDGFTVTEVMVAIAVFAIVATFLTHMLASGYAGVLLAKRREAATQEASRVIEIARSLAFAQIGLIQSDATIPSDGAIKTENGVSLTLRNLCRRGL
ncbi:MAG: prepilin-type N-terminal cleavage/methylation domain-containing protein, partial [Actinomycetota bacterium]